MVCVCCALVAPAKVKPNTSIARTPASHAAFFIIVPLAILISRLLL
jgi:hypothetical protein